MTMDTAGKAVLFSGVTVLISLTAVMLVPSPAFRSMSLGIMLAVIFVLAATLTLLPAVLAKLGPKVDNLSLPWAHSGEHRSPRFAAWGERLWRHPWRYGIPALVGAARARLPGDAAEDLDALDQGRARPATPRASATTRSRPRWAPAPRARCSSSRPRPTGGDGRARSPEADPGIAQVMPAQPGGGGPRARHGHPAPGPLQPRGRSDHRSAPRTSCRPGTVLGGAVAENHDLQKPALRQDLARDRRRAGARVPAAAVRAAGAAARRGRRAHQPARHRSRVRRREVDLPGRRPALAARLPAPGIPGRVGAGVLLRDDLRDLDGLHDVPALLRQGALGPYATTPRTRWSTGWRTPGG